MSDALRATAQTMLSRLPARRTVVAVGALRIRADAAFAANGLPEHVDAPNARFQIGSLTKTFTALLLAAMVDTGEVSLDEPLAASIGVSTGGLDRITLRNLATHTSGLPRLPPGMRREVPRSERDDPYASYDEERLVAALRATGVRPPSHRRSRYSNFGVAALGLALARAAGRPYAEALRDRVLAPLALHETTFDPGGGPHRLAGHARRARPVRDWRFSAFAPAGGLWSTASDLLRYLDAHLHPERTTLRSALEEVQRPHFAVRPGRLELGLAWALVSGRGRSACWHNGGTGGFSSFAGFVAGADAAVVSLANSRVAGPLTRAGLRTLQDLATP